MLNLLRRSANSWIARVLFLVLILSFSIWGIADYIRYNNFSRDPGIIVGDISVSLEKVREEFNYDIHQLQVSFGRTLKNENARQIWTIHKTVDRLVSLASLDMAARGYKLTVPDTILLRRVSHHQLFQDLHGSFNRILFRHILASRYQSEEAYFEDLHQKMLRAQVSSAVVAGITTAPTQEAYYLYQSAKEERVAEIVTLPVKSVMLPPTTHPESQALEELYKANVASFTKPEYRIISMLLLTKEAMMPLISVSEEEIQQAYKDSLNLLRKPEIRTIEQFWFSEKRKADSVLEQVRQGYTLEQVLTDTLLYPVKGVTRKRLYRHDVRDSFTAEMIFSAPANTLTGPISDNTDWYIFRVTDIVGETIPSLIEASDSIKHSLLSEKVDNILHKVVGEVEDAVGMGVPLENIATKFGLKLITFPPMDKVGLSQDGQPVPTLSTLAHVKKTLLPAAFALVESGQSDFIESEGRYLAIRVDSVIPGYVPPIDDVRQELTARWVELQGKKLARNLAERIITHLKEGLSLQEVAEFSNARMSISSRKFKRISLNEDLPPELTSRLFLLREGEVTIIETTQLLTIARLKKILTGIETDQEVLLETQKNLRNQYITDILSQFTTAIGKEFGVTVNPQALEVP